MSRWGRSVVWSTPVARNHVTGSSNLPDPTVFLYKRMDETSTLHKEWLAELYLELDALKYSTPADHEEYEKIERALAPIVHYARRTATRIGGPKVSPELRAAINASMAKEAAKRAEMSTKRPTRRNFGLY